MALASGAGQVNRNSELIPRRLRRGMRANIKIRLKVLTVEDSLQLAAGNLQLLKMERWAKTGERLVRGCGFQNSAFDQLFIQ
jgi:hypothetical protein